MNYDMFSNNKNDELNPNFIYPRPYIDPMLYMNYYSSDSNQVQNTQPNTMSMEEHMNYMNPYMNSPIMGNNTFDNNIDYDDYYPSVDMNNQNNNTQGMSNNQTMNQNQFQNPNMNMIPNMQYMPNNMMPCPMPCMPNNMMMPGMMFPWMMPNMNMMPNNMMFPWMMSPYMMMPGVPQIHLEEFDEEEM